MSFRITSVCLVLIATAHAQASGQSRNSIDLRSTGEHRLAAGETMDAGTRLAAVDARRRLWLAAVARLQPRADVKALRLPAGELDAYTAALLDVTEDAVRSNAGAAAARMNVHASMNAATFVQRIAAVRRDQDAAFDIVAAWADLQQMRTAPAFEARLLTAQASVAMARTEQSTIGGRAASPDGLRRARALADEALTRAPDSPYPHYVLGDLLLDSQAMEAEAEYRKGLMIQPGSSDAHRRLAEALRRQGKFDEAATELREAMRLDPRSARAHSDLALVFEADRKATEAMAEYREAIRLDADLIDAHNGLAIALARQGRFPDAALEFREMIRIDPDSATAYYNLASVLADMDQDAESAAALREVIRINPNHYNAHYNLGELFRLEGKYDDAAKQFREFLRLAPDDTPAGRRNIERAKSLVQKFEDQEPSHSP